MNDARKPLKGRNVFAMLVLLAALTVPATPARAEMDDMFGVMFRMMLVMMNVMSDAMLNNSNNNWTNTFGNNWGGLNSFNLGMSAFPAMSGFGSPWNSFGTPWQSFASPWNSFGTPWNSFGNTPWSGTPWSYPGSPYSGYPYSGGFPAVPDAGYGFPISQSPYEVPAPLPSSAILEGRWFGNSGEILEIHNDRFQLRTQGATLGGSVRVNNNIVNLYSPQTNTVTRYTFLRNQSELILSNGNTVLRFRKHPADSTLHVF